jgi:limonene-1,2-epoxide hydrolase
MKAHRVLRIPLMELVIVALILLTIWQDSQAPIYAESSETINTFHSAINSDDVDAVLALFAEDATVIDSGSVIHGRDEIRDWALHSQRMAGLHLRLIHSQVVGEKVFWNDLAHNGPEVQHLSYILRWMAIIQKGKIKSIMVSLMPIPDGK